MTDSKLLKPKAYSLTAIHTPVLLHEAIFGLDPRPGEIIVDGTLGAGGHAAALAERIGKRGTLVGIDLDEEAILRSRKTLSGFKGKLNLVCGNFRNLGDILAKLKIAKVDKILLDLGISSYHLESSGRGFSFKKDEPLKMTLGEKSEQLFTAYEIVNEWDEENISEILRVYGDEKYSARIARAITTKRKSKQIKTSSELAEIVRKAVPSFVLRKKIHPATKTFQAIRIAVNDELGALKQGLSEGVEHLKKGGRIAVISFHSLEDRIVKRFFKEMSAQSEIKILTKRPIVPSSEEIERNPRGRSAKLRTAEKK